MLINRAFFRDYWQKKPLVLRNAVNLPETHPGKEALFSLAGDENIESRLVLEHGERPWEVHFGPFTRAELEALREELRQLRGVNRALDTRLVELEQRLRVERGLGILLISHDLGVVAGLCDRVLVMHRGEEKESGPVDDIFYRPQHPYTRALLKAVPRLDQAGGRLAALDEEEAALAGTAAGTVQSEPDRTARPLLEAIRAASRTTVAA